jgi:hypothetical protein
MWTECLNILQIYKFQKIFFCYVCGVCVCVCVCENADRH